MKYGNIDIQDLKYGESQIQKRYYGEQLIWEKASGGYDADVQAYMNRIDNDLGSYDMQAIDELNTYVLWLKANNLWNDVFNFVPSAGYKSGTLYSLVPNDGTADYIVSRNSVATRVDPNGLIETVSANTPRIDFSSGEARILIEATSANLFLNSDIGATQTITVLDATTYTFYFREGAGSIQLTGATTQTVSVSDALFNNAVTFTTSGTSLTCTIIGEANKVQLEKQPQSSSYIPTSGSAVTRPNEVIKTDTLATATLFNNGVSLFTDMQEIKSLTNGFFGNIKINSIANVSGAFINGFRASFNRFRATIYGDNGSGNVNYSSVIPSPYSYLFVETWQGITGDYKAKSNFANVYNVTIASNTTSDDRPLALQDVYYGNYVLNRGMVFNRVLTNEEMILLTT